MLGVSFEGDYAYQVNGCRATIHCNEINNMAYYSMFIKDINPVLFVTHTQICTNVTYEEFIRMYGFNPRSLKKVC